MVLYKQKILFFISISFLFIKLDGLKLSDDMIFLKNFFKEKNIMITINTCWRSSEIKTFLRYNMQSENPKQMAIHKNLSLKTIDYFFNYLSTNNWFVMDFINCKNYERLLEGINKKKLFRYPLKHLILIEETNYTTLLETIKSFIVLPMSEVVIACLKKSSANLYQPYKIGENESFIIENYGQWSLEKGVTAFYNAGQFAERRRNFKKFKILTGLAVKAEASTLVDNLDDITGFKGGEPYFFQEIPNMLNLIQYLNASYAFRVFDSYGYLNHTTGKFNGLAEDLYEERSHISGLSLVISEDRHRIIEYIKSYGYWSIGAKFILKKPSMSYVENIYYMTFANEVWIAAFVVLLIFGIVLYVLLNWEIKNVEGKHRQIKFTAGDITLLSLEAVCQQGTYVDSKTFSGRTIILILFTAFMFFYVAYSSYILVLLQSTKPITSIRKLVDSRIQCGGYNVSFLMAYYEATKDEALRDLYRKKIYPNRFYSLEDGLKKVQKGNFAFQVILGPAYDFILKTYTNYDICKLQELPGYMNDQMYIAVPKTSQYKKLFKIGLLIADERGLQNRVKHRVSMKPKCYNEAGNFQSVRIYDCYFVIVLFAVGVLLSLVVLLVEKLIAKYIKNRERITI